MELTSVTAVPIIMALTQLSKELGTPNRLLPVVNLIFGIASAIVLFHLTVPAVVTGIVYGLTAAGLYRSIKVTGLGL